MDSILAVLIYDRKQKRITTKVMSSIVPKRVRTVSILPARIPLDMHFSLSLDPAKYLVVSETQFFAQE